MRRAAYLICGATITFVLVLSGVRPRSEGTVRNNVIDVAGDPTKPSYVAAVERIRELAENLRGDRGPVVVGGIGDSGTRGVRQVLIDLGVFMMTSSFLTSKSKDSMLFMKDYPSIDDSKNVLNRGPAGLYNSGIKATRSLKYDRVSVNSEKWNLGVQAFAQMVGAHFQVFETFSTNEKTTIWGFKHPRTALVLPYANAVLKSKMKFVLVVRDGKEIALGSNQKLFEDHCGRYYAKKCEQTVKSKVRFWADLHLDLLAWLEHHALFDYRVVRVEDLVRSRRECFELLHDWVHETDAAADAAAPRRKKLRERRIEKALTANSPYKSHYMGHKFSEEQKRHVHKQIEDDLVIAKAFERLGYSNVYFGPDPETKCVTL